MTRKRAIAEVVHITCLSLWLGVSLMSGVLAAIIFPTMKTLNPRLPDFESFTGDHWKIAAGKVAAQVFDLSRHAEVTLMWCAVVSLLAAIYFGMPLGRLTTTRFTLVLIASLLLLCGNHFIIKPLTSDLTSYWTAAQAGQNDVAFTHQHAFEARHGSAGTFLAITAAFLLAALAAAAWSLAAPRNRYSRIRP